MVNDMGKTWRGKEREYNKKQKDKNKRGVKKWK